MFLQCIRSLHFLKDVSDFFRFISAVCTCLRSLHVIRCFSYVSALYTFRNVFLRDLLFFVYIRFMSWDGFPMYLHCIRSLRFFESCCFFLTQTGISCLYPLHVMG